MRGVMVAAANAVAKKYCDPKDWEVVLIGDCKEVEPTLDGLGMPVIPYDPQGNRLQ